MWTTRTWDRRSKRGADAPTVSTQAIDREKTGPLRFDFIDGMRGAAALYVLMHHIWQFSITSPKTTPPSWFRAASVFKYGSYAVAVFIVISGYCLMLPVLRHGGRTRLAEFARRRSRRILPPYFVALAASMLAIALFSGLRHTSLKPMDITLPSFTTGKVVSHLLLVHNWSESWHYGFDPPLWSIALEFQIYFVFALLLLPVWRRWGLRAATATAFAISLVPWMLGAGFAAPWMLGMFALGMAAAALSIEPQMAVWRRRIPWRPLTMGLIVAVLLVTKATTSLESVNLQTMLCHLTVGLATMAGLVALASGDAPTPTRSAHRVLASRPLRSVGLFSYSLYLIHYPIVAIVTISWLDRYDLDVPATFAVLSLICVPASLLVAKLFFILVERPFLNTPVAPPPDIDLTDGARQ